MVNLSNAATRPITGSNMQNKFVELLKKHKNESSVLVETGTYHGDGIAAALKAGYKSVISFEVNEKHYQECLQRFKHYEPTEVMLFNESSESDVFKSIVYTWFMPVTFWLDAHLMSSKGTGRRDYPLSSELSVILNSDFNHTVLIDDVRLFNRYNVDIVRIKQLFKEKDPNYRFCFETAKMGFPNDVLAVWREGNE